MTRKDYVLIAAALNTARVQVQDTPAEMHGTCARFIADELARDNPRFDRSRFLKAAGVIS